jgi:hypothetical protein
MTGHTRLFENSTINLWTSFKKKPAHSERFAHGEKPMPAFNTAEDTQETQEGDSEEGAPAADADGEDNVAEKKGEATIAVESKMRR